MYQNNGFDFLLSRPMNIGETLENALVGHFQLHLSDTVAQTPMHTVTKCNVFFDIITG